MKFKTVIDGEWISPRMSDWRMQCCRCGLVHTLQFRVRRHGKRNEVQFRAWRHPRKKKKLAQAVHTCMDSMP